MPGQCDSTFIPLASAGNQGRYFSCIDFVLAMFWGVWGPCVAAFCVWRCCDLLDGVCVWGREKQRSPVSLGWHLVCYRLLSWLTTSRLACRSAVGSALPTAEEIGGRSPLQAWEQTGPSVGLEGHRIPCKGPLQRADRAENSESDSDSSLLDPDSDGESGAEFTKDLKSRVLSLDLSHDLGQDWMHINKQALTQIKTPVRVSE